MKRTHNIFNFIPKDFFGDGGVFRDNNNNVIFCRDLITAMETGQYDWLSTHWVWNKEEYPVTIKQGRMYSSTSLGNWHYALIWFFRKLDQKWYGYEFYPRHWGTSVYWRALDPEHPLYVSDEPKNSEDFYPDPIYKTDQKQFFSFISDILMIEEETSPHAFAEKMAKAAVEPHLAGYARFFAVPLHNGSWGWVYQTISHRQLIFANGIVYTQGLRESETFREWIEENFIPIDEDEPEWLSASLQLAIELKRNYYDDKDLLVVDNSTFFEAIETDPYTFFKDKIKKPEATQKHCYDYFASIAEENLKNYELKAYKAFNKLFGRDKGQK